jgi:hypothetical protein
MKLADLTSETLAKIKTVRWDRIIEKHEGPENWESVLRYYDPEFMMVEGQAVLLPVDKSQHPNIHIIRSIWSADRNCVTLFLQDTTYDDDWASSGYLAICDRVAGEDLWLAIVYHEWFIIERSSIFEF